MIFQKTIKGNLQRLGNSQVYSNQRKYSVIQIDNTVIKNVWVSDTLDSFLDVGENIEITIIRAPMSFYRKGLISIKSDSIAIKEKFFKIFISALGLAFINMLISAILIYIIGYSYIPEIEFDSFVRFWVAIGFFEITRFTYSLISS